MELLESLAMTTSIEILECDSVDDNMLVDAAALFSNHYGTWSAAAESQCCRIKAGDRVQLTAKRLRSEYLGAEGCFLVRAFVDKKFAGHAFGKRFTMRDNRQGVWITQLVVDSNHRHQNLAKKLIYQCCCDARVDICGLVTSHPYAVRALERATKRPVIREYVLAEADAICRATGVGYLANSKFHFDLGKTVIRTNFYVDHTEILAILQAYDGWNLGPVCDGEEFVAIVFPHSTLAACLHLKEVLRSKKDRQMLYDTLVFMIAVYLWWQVLKQYIHRPLQVLENEKHEDGSAIDDKGNITIELN
jgi:hypothetical protein